ncbi:MAG: metal-sensing transcriptional repressor [Burkholderiales bacterium]|nr:metal-sensing transcriptional repressor [Burkholderiales bacterium]
MSEALSHEGHGALIKRLKRAGGHLQNVIEMIEADRPCAELAQQLHAVERAITAAKKALIHEHLDHCLSKVVPSAKSDAVLSEFKDITKYL